MKKRFLSVFLALALCMGLCAVPASAADTQSKTPTETEAYQAMIALKTEYPEGMHWTNDNSYTWKGGIYSTGYGCAGFAFLLSDAAFGALPARMLTDFTLSDVRVGDILRINDDTHSVIVLEVRNNDVVIAEGNYNNSIHWGRTLTAATVQSAKYLLTRYPEADPTVPTIPTAPSFTDVAAGSWYAQHVAWAAEADITNGTGNNKFSPGQDCTHAQILTFLYRAQREDGTASSNDDMALAVEWAREEGMIDDSFDPNANCTRSDAVNYIWQAFGSVDPETEAGFTDVADDADYAAAANWAFENGIVDGTSKTETVFSPGKVCDRATIVTLLHRAYVEEVRLIA